MGDNLRSRGFNFVDWCVMCCCCGEAFFRHLEFFSIVFDVVYLEGVIGGRLRMWIVWITCCFF